ncbi:MAG: hypothetical protein IH968_07005 [Gemmatimonadetes bacterium]|nr:hypothetical protein [Gemmatimonadota bacterium]
MFLLLAVGHPTALSGQWVRGTLVELGTGTPIEGAAIVALDPDDRRLAWTLTDALGRFFFRVRTSGSFVIRSDRIGHTSTRSEPLEVGAADTLVYRLEVPLDAIKLVGLTVEGSSRDCRIRPEEGVATARVWEEARKALEAAAQTSRRGIYQFMVRHHDRELDNRGRKILKETSRIDRLVKARPFKSLEASRLIEEGFVQPDGDGFIYYAPDADVLLSDEFLDSHCMKLREGDGEDEGLLGLEFEPTEDRSVPDISGTLWLEPVSAKLQRLEFRYENLGYSVGRAPIGGTVVFAGLPNGTWFVTNWAIRMPNLVEERTPLTSISGGLPTRSTIRVVGIHEEGALVLQVRNARGDVVVEAGAGTITGVVVEEDDETPVSDALVSVWITGQQAITGSDGLFRLGSLGDGTYDLLVTHPSLTSLGHGGELTPVRAVSGEVTSVRLTLPSQKRILEEVCVGPGPDRGGIIAGWVKHSETDEPIGDASVLLTTTTFMIFGGEGGIREQRSGVEALTRDDGFFIYCGTAVQADVDIEVTAEGMTAWKGVVEIPHKGYVAHVAVRLEPERKDP